MIHSARSPCVSDELIYCCFKNFWNLWCKNIYLTIRMHTLTVVTNHCTGCIPLRCAVKLTLQQPYRWIIIHPLYIYMCVLCISSCSEFQSETILTVPPSVQHVGTHTRTHVHFSTTLSDDRGFEKKKNKIYIYICVQCTHDTCV